MWDIILDAFLDTLKVFPFLLVIYILIEFIEHKTTFTRNHKILQGNLAPLIGSATGLIPQCGFSVMAAKLYDRGLIRTGTLLAVLIATSDEAFIILLSSGTAAAAIMPLVVIKLLVGVGVGYLVNFLYSAEKLSNECEEEIHAYSCGREHEGESNLKLYLLNPLLHSLLIAFYLLIVNLIFGFVIAQVGEETIASAMIGGVYFQPFITSLIGLIPNCASSAIITGTYIHGGITFGSCVAGLCANAGLGLVVLFKNTKRIKRNIMFVLTLYLISVAAGLIVNVIEMACGMI
ncbi:MAG: arsenic efflux protein [Clostridia bacterium]|nr:arsenic efflux protein [Clostridia bacterium]